MESKKQKPPYKPSFLIYEQWIDSLSTFTHAEVGELVLALSYYNRTGKVPDLGDRLGGVFYFIKTRFDQDDEKYQEIVKKRTYAAKAMHRKKNEANACS